MASLRQIRANQLNALKSTGPTTAEGKAVARRNALKHGLAGTGIVLPEDEAEAVNRALGPVAILAQARRRLFRLGGRADRRAGDPPGALRAPRAGPAGIRAARAGRDWDLERQLAAESLGEVLPKSPARVALELRRTAAGRAWLRSAGRGWGRSSTPAGPGTRPSGRWRWTCSARPPRCDRARPAPTPSRRPSAPWSPPSWPALQAIDPDAGRGRRRADGRRAGLRPGRPELALVRRYGRSLTRQIDEFRKQVRSAVRPYAPAASEPRQATRPPAPQPVAEARSPAAEARIRRGSGGDPGRDRRPPRPDDPRTAPIGSRPARRHAPRRPLPPPNRKARRAAGVGTRDRRRA